jgi:tetratricopeptide (TPR) repeat protein
MIIGKETDHDRKSSYLLTAPAVLKIISTFALFVSSLILIYFAATYSSSKKRVPQSLKAPLVSSPAVKSDLMDRAELYFEMANQAYQEGDYNKAKHYLIEAAQIHPEDRFSRLEQAVHEALMLKEMYHEKLTTKHEKEKIKGKIDLYLKTAENHIQKREWDLAAIAYQEILLLDNNDETAKRGIFNVERLRHEYPMKHKMIKTPESLGIYNQIEQKIQKAQNLADQENYLETIREYKEALELSKKYDFNSSEIVFALTEIMTELKEQIDTLLQEAEGLSETQDYAEAQKKLKEILKLNPYYKPAIEKQARLSALLVKKAQMIYSQAVIFESLPDIEAAKTQWKKITSLLSPGHLYYKKAAKKLTQYATY